MPAKSKAQFRLFKAIWEGSLPSGYLGISKKVACEYIKGQSPKGLPEKLTKKKKYGKKSKKKRKKRKKRRR